MTNTLTANQVRPKGTEENPSQKAIRVPLRITDLREARHAYEEQGSEYDFGRSRFGERP